MDIMSYLLGKKASGAILNEYFDTTINSNSYQAKNAVKKIPDFVITSDVTSLYRVFLDYVPPAKEITVTGDTSNVTSVGSMFYHSATHKKVILKDLDFPKLTTFNSMFYQNNMNQYGPSEIVLNITTSNKITQISDTFRNCSYLTSISGLNNINATNCTVFTSIFENCWNLASIDISGWNPSGQFRVDNMFNGCSGLRHLDIRGLTLTNITNMGFFLGGVPTNCEIIVKDQTQKDWMTTNFSAYTNVKTAAEYEAEQQTS